MLCRKNDGKPFPLYACLIDGQAAAQLVHPQSLPLRLPIIYGSVRLCRRAGVLPRAVPTFPSSLPREGDSWGVLHGPSAAIHAPGVPGTDSSALNQDLAAWSRPGSAPVLFLPCLQTQGNNSGGILQRCREER